MEKYKLAFLVILIFSLALFLSGCSSTTPTNQSPNANFNANPTSGEAPLEVSFDGSNSSDSDGSVISYEWDFGDDSTGSGKTATHTYNSSGNYSAKLTVTDDEGSMGAITKTIEVESATLSPPSWILGEWVNEYDTYTFTFSSSNVTMTDSLRTVNFNEIAKEYYVKENSSSSAYSLEVPDEANIGSLEGDMTLTFEKVSATELNYIRKYGANTLAPVTLYKQ